MGERTTSAAQTRLRWVLWMAIAVIVGVAAPGLAQPCLEPAANFSGTPEVGCSPLNVQFTDLSTNGPTSWLWDFGDGATSGTQSPAHTYSSPGEYTVSLTVANACGADTEIVPIYIIAEATPVAQFSAVPLTACTSSVVEFRDLSPALRNSWNWDFGDGATSTDIHPSHTYATAGTYDVTLTVGGPCGTDTETKQDYITVTDCGANSARIFVYKIVEGVAPPIDWQFTGTMGQFALADGEDDDFTVPSGVPYTITEIALPGFVVSHRVGGGNLVSGNSVTVTPLAGQEVAVDFINTVSEIPPVDGGTAGGSKSAPTLTDAGTAALVTLLCGVVAWRLRRRVARG